MHSAQCLDCENCRLIHTPHDRRTPRPGRRPLVDANDLVHLVLALAHVPQYQLRLFRGTACILRRPLVLQGAHDFGLDGRWHSLFSAPSCKTKRRHSRLELTCGEDCLSFGTLISDYFSLSSKVFQTYLDSKLLAKVGTFEEKAHTFFTDWASCSN